MPPPLAEPNPPAKSRPRLNPRIALLVIILIVAISGVTILTDVVSPRHRHFQPATAPGALPASLR